jgi:hypothetical protein
MYQGNLCEATIVYAEHFDAKSLKKLFQRASHLLSSGCGGSTDVSNPGKWSIIRIGLGYRGSTPPSESPEKATAEISSV